MPSASALNHLHKQLVSALQSRAKIKLPDLVIVGPEGWQDYREKSRLGFQLRSGGVTETAQRLRGGRCHVYEFPGYDTLAGAVWFSWYEEWLKTSRREYDLVGASLTFFWGPMRRQHQVLRAEWDAVQHRGGHAAQPHWHIDATYLIEFSGLLPPAGPSPAIAERAEPAALEELEELPTDAAPAQPPPPTPYLQDVDLGGLHLGMGGWENPGAAPGCWQRKPTEDVLVTWADSTLAYAIAQFDELKTSVP